MRARLRGWHLAVMLVAVVAVAGAVQAAMAAIGGTSAGAVVAVGIARSTDATSTTSTSYVNLPGALVNMRGQGLLVVRFSAESRCSAGTNGDWCTVEVLVDGVQAKPDSGFDYAFDSVDGDLWEGNAVERSIKVGPGLHHIRVRYAVVGSGARFRLDDWSMSVERAAT
jgi:hypothetical protein